MVTVTGNWKHGYCETGGANASDYPQSRRDATGHIPQGFQPRYYNLFLRLI